jgi:hypothetical protein
MLSAVYSLVMTYASLSAIVFILCVVKNCEGMRSLIRVAFLFVCSYALSILTIYVMNYIYHGHFGLEIQAWREPHPYSNVGDIYPNSIKYFSKLLEEISGWRTVFILSALGWLMCFCASELREKTMYVLLSVLAWALVELLLEIKTGISIAVRSEL